MPSLSDEGAGKSAPRVDSSEKKRAAIRATIIALGALFDAEDVLEKPTPTAPARFDQERAWRWIQRNCEARGHRSLMRFAAWLWKSGTHDNELVIAILSDCLSRRPAEPYAYYASEGPRRDCMTASHNIHTADVENQRLKEYDRNWLAESGESRGQG